MTNTNTNTNNAPLSIEQLDAFDAAIDLQSTYINADVAFAEGVLKLVESGWQSAMLAAKRSGAQSATYNMAMGRMAARIFKDSPEDAAIFAGSRPKSGDARKKYDTLYKRVSMRIAAMRERIERHEIGAGMSGTSPVEEAKKGVEKAKKGTKPEPRNLGRRILEESGKLVKAIEADASGKKDVPDLTATARADLIAAFNAVIEVCNRNGFK
jgi:hypothetical protein